MKVLHLIAPGPIAGAEKVVIAGTRALRAEGVDAHVGVIADGRAATHAQTFMNLLRDAQVPVWEEATSRRLDMGLVVRLGQRVRQERYDVVHVHGYKALVHALPLRLSKPVVATQHGHTAHTTAVSLYERCSEALLRLLPRTFVVSEPLRQRLLERGVPAARIVVMDNMLSLDGAAILGARQKVHAHRLRLLFLGRLSPEKGLDVLLQAYASFAKSRPEPRRIPEITVVGDGPERQALEAQARALPEACQVNFAGFQSAIEPYIISCSALVMPSYREGMPMSLLEATAGGLPVLASRVGAVPSLVEDGKTGLLLPPGDVHAWTRGLATFEQSLSRFEAAAAIHARQVQQRYSPERWARRTLEHYRQLAAVSESRSSNRRVG